MDYAANLWLFFILLFGIIAVPGMDMLFVLANALTGGRDRGLAATGGIMVGGMVHTLNGAIGVGLLMHFVPILFKPLLIAGAAYMAFIGITLMRSSITVGQDGPAGSRSAWKAFRQGFVTCLINPKAYLFVLAVYPQFLKPDYGPIWMQATIMGLMTVLTQAAIYGGLAIKRLR
ncbi:MAG: LysE family translocator, partial [Mesorhizobium sp.]|uniref:LysE family translocator n=1 Tax=Mesorhizobium sp. TaxID=1871066 RepID=UPI000FEA1505